MESCPHCQADIEDFLNLSIAEGSLEPDNSFEDDCPECENRIRVEVDFDPVFYISKKEGAN